MLICGCAATQKNSPKKVNAEVYYEKALSILEKTTISKSLANKALTYINKAIHSDPSQSKYYCVRGVAYHRSKRYDLALLDYNQTLKLDSTSSLNWVNRAILYENTERYSLAEQDYLKALEYERESISIYLSLTTLYSKWGKDSLFIGSCNNIIRIDPNYRSAYVYRGYVNLKQGNSVKALSDYTIALDLDSNDKISYNNRGLCKYYLKQYEAAIIDFNKALKIKVDVLSYENSKIDGYSYNNIANSYFALGDTEKACIYWHMAIKNEYQYNNEWKIIYHIDDPNELIKTYCK